MSAASGPRPKTKGLDIASLIRATGRHKDGEDWHARRSQHQSERKDVAGNGRAGHPAPLRGDQRVAPAGAAVRLRPRPVRLVLGPCRRGGDSVLHHSGRKHRREINHDAGRPARTLCGAESAASGAGNAPAAASVHRRAGDPVRILLQRNDHQSFGAAGEESQADRSGNSRAHEWPSLPLRKLSAGDAGHCARRQHNGGRRAMTMHTRLPFSRRDLLKAGGGLGVGFRMGGAASPAAPARGDAAGPPDPSTIDSWIAVHADNTATIYLGKGEFGQGNTTGLLQIAGEELDLDMSQLKWVGLDTNVTPNQGATTSSSSIHRGGPQVRAAAAEAREALLALASTRLGVQTGSLTVSKGVVSIDGHPTRSVTYGALLGDKPFEVKFTGAAPQKPINRYRLVGTRVPRVDIPEKAGGKYVHMQHVRV